MGVCLINTKNWGLVLKALSFLWAEMNNGININEEDRKILYTCLEF